MEKEYLSLLNRVLLNGEQRDDRTGVGTISLFGEQIRCDLSKGFPLLTTKKMAWKAIVGELLWFLKGSSDERELAEITHGTREGVTTIWTPNALAPYWKDKARFPGDLGRVYGVQWRKWRSYDVQMYNDYLASPEGSDTLYTGATVAVREHDQIKKIIETIKTNPTDRRMILTAFNVGEIDNMALPPCHMFAQFYVSTKGMQKRLSCQVYIRSNDLFLGLPFNIASYALLTHMIAHVTNLHMGELIITIGDAHIYKNHVQQVKEQLTRSILASPVVVLNRDIKDIDSFSMKDIMLIDYTSHGPLQAPMAV
jgi:thymidylate synthase